MRFDPVPTMQAAVNAVIAWSLNVDKPKFFRWEKDHGQCIPNFMPGHEHIHSEHAVMGVVKSSLKSTGTERRGATLTLCCENGGTHRRHQPKALASGNFRSSGTKKVDCPWSVHISEFKEGYMLEHGLHGARPIHTHSMTNSQTQMVAGWHWIEGLPYCATRLCTPRD